MPVTVSCSIHTTARLYHLTGQIRAQERLEINHREIAGISFSIRQDRLAG
jgi:hypothetical protein